MAKKVKKYLNLPKKYSDYEKSKVVVLPLPFDKTSSWLKGADKGPAALINSSAVIELYDIETESEPYKIGISTAKAIKATDGKVLNKKAEAAVRKFLQDDKFVVTLGGEHSISLGPIIAHAEKYPDMSILHLDAHSDRRETYHGTSLSHACIIARSQNYSKNIVSVGIRSIDASEKERMDRDKIFFAKDIVGKTDWVQKVVDNLGENVYITIDLDVFDPSVLPATGTPEPGGLNWYEVVGLMKAVAEKKNIIGFDLNELCPMPNMRASEFLAAKLVYQILAYKFMLKK